MKFLTVEKNDIIFIINVQNGLDKQMDEYMAQKAK